MEKSMLFYLLNRGSKVRINHKYALKKILALIRDILWPINVQCQNIFKCLLNTTSCEGIEPPNHLTEHHSPGPYIALKAIT